MKRTIIYLDNAATAWPKPPEVIETVKTCMRFHSNAGRGAHYLASKTTEMVYEAREILAAFFNAPDPLKVIFTKNCTEAINVALHGILRKGDHVIVSKMEHNAVVRPLYELKRRGLITLTAVGDHETGYYEPALIQRAITSKTRMIISTASSNVTGLIMPMKEIGAIAKKYGVLYMVDGAQGAGALPIDLQKMKIDIFAFAGHKSLMGPQGTGGLILSENLGITPLIQGGTGGDSLNPYQPATLPESLESGTLNTHGIAGLSEGIRFINRYGMERIINKKQQHIRYLLNSLSERNDVTLYSKQAVYLNSGIVSFNIKGMDSQNAAYELDKRYGIAVRAGLHCAPSAHKLLNTLETGCVRVSVGVFNTLNDISLLIDAILDLIKELH